MGLMKYLNTQLQNQTKKNELLKDDLKEAIELMLQLDDDKNYSLSDIERDKFAKILKNL